MMREPADHQTVFVVVVPGRGHITLISSLLPNGQGETDGPRGTQAGKRHLAISNSRRPRRSRVGIRARLRQPYGERLAPHSCWAVARHTSTRSYRRGIPSMARQGETTCVQRWSSRSERSSWVGESTTTIIDALSTGIVARCRAGHEAIWSGRAHCGCIAHIADLDGVARRFLFPSFPSRSAGCVFHLHSPLF